VWTGYLSKGRLLESDVATTKSTAQTGSALLKNQKTYYVPSSVVLTQRKTGNRREKKESGGD